MRSLAKITLLLLIVIAVGCKNNQKKEQENKTEIQVSENQASKSVVDENQIIYQFSVKDIDGNTFNFEDLKGKKIMVVNTASKCGFTPQYEELEELYKIYKDDKDFIIVGFPANNFASQEPGNNKEIKEFCNSNYQISFPMMSKISVKGEDVAPIYKFLTSKSENGVKNSEVKWNFQKYLIGRDGRLEKVLESKVSPKNPIIVSWITEDKS